MTTNVFHMDGESCYLYTCDFWRNVTFVSSVISYHISECLDSFRILISPTAHQVGANRLLQIFPQSFWQTATVILNWKAFKKAQQPCWRGIKPELCLPDLPDVVVDGVLQGFYPRDVRVSFTAPALTEPTSSIEAWNNGLLFTVKYTVSARKRNET